MSDYSRLARALLWLSTASLVACTVPTAEGVDVRADGITKEIGTKKAGAVAALVALTDPASLGGATVTAAEAAGYVARVSSFAGDESVDALAVLVGIRDADSIAAVQTITIALRRRVEGVRIAGMRVSGLTISSCATGVATATFDPGATPYTRVDLVYSGDAWATSHAATLVKNGQGRFEATLPGLDPHGYVTFAVALGQPGGDTLWLNNPRENVIGAVSHIDFRQAVDLCAPSVTSKTPQLARFVRGLALPESLGGTTVTWDEISGLVAYTTYEGGPGMDDADVIDPALDALDAMKAEGVAFEADSYALGRSFLVQMRMRVASTDALSLNRGANGFASVTAPLGAQHMRLYYSTDGWNAAKVAECTPLGRAGLVTCGIGFLPGDALVSYSAIVTDARGAELPVHASDGGNVFRKAR